MLERPARPMAILLFEYRWLPAFYGKFAPMSRFAPAFLRRSPGLLLLGLLALLLWGQCSLTGSGRSTPAPNLFITVAQTDSLMAPTSGQPALLYLTLRLTNTKSTPVALHAAHGELVYRQQHWAWSWQPPTALQVPDQSERRLPIAVRLLAADSLAQLRHALVTAEYLPLLYIHARYSVGASQRVLYRDDADYLQLLPQPAVKPQPDGQSKPKK